ncbi:MAG: S9 family peptidase [Planctomycetota bacterium]|nr:MAG: S9 family peptidase [Planctomycetota bacterium]
MQQRLLLAGLVAASLWSPPLFSQQSRLSLEQASGRAQAPSYWGTPIRWRWGPERKLLRNGEDWRHPMDFSQADAPATAEPERRRSQQNQARQQLPESVRKGAELVEAAPDGNRIAFVRSNNLWIYEPESDRSRALTEDGNDEWFNGKLDWVYQEEIYGRGNFKGFWWSPNSRFIAYLALDESPVHEFTVIDHIEPNTFRVKPEISNYPKAGDPNPVVHLRIVDVQNGAHARVDLSPYRDQEPLIVRVGWTPDSSQLLFVIQDRIQSWAELMSADPENGRYQRMIRESSDSWVNRPNLPRWLQDGSFLWLSERTGHQHLYHYRKDGRLIRPVTQGDWSVRSIQHLDEEQGLLWFSSNRDGAINQNVYRIRLDGTGLRRLTQGEGSHRLSFNHDRSLFLDSVSSLTHPGEMRLCDADGNILRVLEEASVPAAKTHALAKWEALQIPAGDGFLLDAALLKPADFDPSKQYPVWLPTYSGPDAPSVRNRWNGSAWYQFLAQQGFLVFQVNVRTASGKGHWAIEQCYRRLGVMELSDLVDAVDWLCRHSWADGSRVGITGYSYGGFMAAYALTKSDRFALGIAGGGVFDWGMYDTIYTERYMSTPQRNPEGYQATSVLDAAADLNGHLFIHHGVMDDNVHVQNAMQLIYALQKAGKDFDFMLYPQSRHGVGDRDQRWHLRRFEWRLIQEHLGP